MSKETSAAAGDDCCRQPSCAPPPQGEPTPETRRSRAILSCLGYCGHFLHFNLGGRSGKAHILVRLSRHGGEMGQRELQECFDLKAGSLSEILSKLECAGLIERTRAEGDRRQLVVRLTETGWAMAEEDRRDRELFERTAFSPLSPAEQEQLLGMLTKIQRHWESNDD